MVTVFGATSATISAGSGNHPACSFSGQLIQRFCDFGGLSFNVICGKLEHGVSFLRLLPLGLVTLRIRRLYHVGNPQLLIITHCRWM
jgi:hypothetical protein